jgi:hypothetical protein
MCLILNIFPDYSGGDFISYTSHKVTVIPNLSCPKLLPELGKLLKYLFCRYAFQHLHQLYRRVFGGRFQKQVHMVFYYFHLIYLKPILLAYPFEHFLQVHRDLPTQYVFSVFRHPNQMVFQIVDRVLGPSYSHVLFITVTTLLWQPLFLTSPYGEPLSSPQQS